MTKESLIAELNLRTQALADSIQNDDGRIILNARYVEAIAGFIAESEVLDTVD